MRYSLIGDTSETGLAYWASYLINGDASGLTDEEIAECDAWLASIQPSDPLQYASVTSCGESYIGRFWSGTISRGMLADLVDYEFLIYQQES